VSINMQSDFAFRTSQLFELNLSIVALLDFPVQIFTQFLHLFLCVVCVCVCVLSTAHVADVCLVQEFDPVFVV
jgi:hypothetical protein